MFGKKEPKNRSGEYTITLFLIFLAGLNFFNMYVELSLLAALLFLLMRKRVVMDKNLLPLLLLFLSWLFFSPGSRNLSITAMLKPMVYLLMYLVGRNLLRNRNRTWNLEEQEGLLRQAVVIAAAGPYIHYLLNFFTGINSFSRNTIDFWTGTIISATNQAVMPCLMLGICIAGLLSSGSKGKRWLSVAVLVSIYLYNLILSGRTLLVLGVIVALVCVVFLRRSSPDRRDKYKPVLVILCIVCAAYAVYSANLFGIRDTLLSSNLFLRLSRKSGSQLLSSGRMSQKIKYLRNFGKSLLGGRKIYNTGIGYAHDLYLDTYDEAGIIALVAVVASVISAVVYAVRFLKNKQYSVSLRVMILAVYCAVLMEFLTEPILQGVPWLFALFCFLHGLIVSCVKDCTEADRVSSPGQREYAL